MTTPVHTLRTKAKKTRAANRSAWRLSRFRWVYHPVTIFVVLQVAWVSITAMWVVWFLGAEDRLSRLVQLVEQQGVDLGFNDQTTILFLIFGCVLLGMLLVGTVLLFVFGQRQASFLRKQKAFLSSVTHELRSPLASLRLGFDTIVDRDLKGDVADKLRHLMAFDVDRLSRLVDRILVSARLDRGLALTEKADAVVPVVATIHDIVRSLAYLDEKLAIRVNVTGISSLQVNMTRESLDLVLGNLLENAVKYSPKGSPIKITIGPADKGNVRVVIEDRGLGLTEKEQKRIFNMFHRSEAVLERAIPGTGLGLFIVREVVKQLGGSIEVFSKGPGEGSRFTLILPGAKDEA